jgi:hypothetical protein
MTQSLRSCGTTTLWCWELACQERYATICLQTVDIGELIDELVLALDDQKQKREGAWGGTSRHFALSGHLLSKPRATWEPRKIERLRRERLPFRFESESRPLQHRNVGPGREAGPLSVGDMSDRDVVCAKTRSDRRTE